MKRFKILVTAGSTIVPIDQVRNISNIFKGRTGTDIAIELSALGAEVVLLTSNSNLLLEISRQTNPNHGISKIISFRTYDELLKIMEEEIKTKTYDVVIHSAAVSDYQVKEVCILKDQKLLAIDKNKKVSGDHQDLYLHLSPTKKIVNLIRSPWNFQGYLVKFKLQVGISDQELIEIARQSRLDSRADMIVANCLEWAKDRAYILTAENEIHTDRQLLTQQIYEQILKEES